HGESFVDLEQIDVGGSPAHLLVQLFDRADRGGGEPLRLLRVGGVGQQFGNGLQAHLVGGGLAHHHQRGGTVVDGGRGGGGDGAVFLERRLQRRDFLRLGLQGSFVLVDHGLAGAALDGDGRDFPFEGAAVGRFLRTL